jgi:hypothetical protein
VHTELNSYRLFLHVFFLLFRKSNLVPNYVSSFKPEKQLNRKNIVYDKEINILLITIKWSKTIQFGERHLIIPIVAIPGSNNFPMFLNRISWCIIYSWVQFNHIQVSLHRT